MKLSHILKYMLLTLLILTGLQSQLFSKTFEFQDMFRIKKAHAPRLSPDGNNVVFEVSEADSAANKWISHIWLTDAATRGSTQLTSGDTSGTDPRWFPDGNRIAFLRKGGEFTNLFQVEMDGGKPVRLFTYPGDITDFRISRDGQKIYFMAKDSLTRAEKKAEAAKDDAYFYDKNAPLIHIWIYSLQDKKLRQLTAGNYSAREFCLSPDETQIAYTAAPSPRINDNPRQEIYLLNLADLSKTRLTNNRIEERQLAWSPDSKYISFTSDADSQLEPYHQDSIFLLDLKTQTITDLLPEFPHQVFSYFWTSEDKFIYFLANTGVNTQFFVLDRSRGGIKQLSSGDQEYRGLHYRSGVDRIVYLESTPRRPFDVFIAQPSKLPGLQITDLNSWLISYSTAQYRTVKWKSPDGHQVEGLLILPAFAEERSYPLIVQLHGGPESSYRNYFGSSWATYPQVWASHGYAVFQPNYRGSTGYGDEVMRSIIGHYFEKDVDDIISGVDYLIEQGIADRDKMAVMGWSAGGHLTNWIVTHFQRFKAACSGAGMSDWYSFYAQTDMQYIREIWHLGPPYSRQEYYMKKSPISYVMQAKTPTLLLCGEQDRRVPFPQSLEMYRGLQSAGCQTELLAFPREGHSLQELQHQMVKMKTEFQWIEKHLFDRNWDLSELN